MTPCSSGRSRNVLGMPLRPVKRNIQDYNQSAQSLHTVATDVRRSTVAYIQEHASDFSGVQVVERTQRQYPYGTLAGHVLGYTGTITSEQLEARTEALEEGTAGARAGQIQYESGDIVGQSGVEIQYESLLQGIRGEQTVQVDVYGNVTGSTSSVPPEPGSDIKLTLDLEIEQACEDGLAHAMSAGQSQGYAEAKKGACVCMDVTNGEILGMASAPVFDSSVFIGGVSNDAWAALSSEESGYPMINRAIAGQYMSASTIKPLSALAALKYGVYTEGQTTVCTGWWTGMGEANGKYCWDHAGHGTMNLQTGITMSCDPVFYDIGKASSTTRRIRRACRRCFADGGSARLRASTFRSKAAGRVPDAEWKSEFFSDWEDADRSWNGGDMYNIAIGQGDILVTPLQMACVYAGIANGGPRVRPPCVPIRVGRDGAGDAASSDAQAA